MTDKITGRPNHIEDALVMMHTRQWFTWTDSKNKIYANLRLTEKVGIDGNADAAAAIYPNVRALKGVLDLTGAGAQVATNIFGELANAQGATAEAFAVTEKRAGFK